jgi:hypothetical protein
MAAGSAGGTPLFTRGGYVLDRRHMIVENDFLGC